MDNVYSIIEMILRSKNRNAMEAYSSDPESLPSFIVCKLLSRNSGCHRESLLNILSMIPVTALNKHDSYMLLEKIIPKTNNTKCLKW